MVAEDSDDLWYAYNLVATGDSVMAVTFRYSLLSVPTPFLAFMVLPLVTSWAIFFWELRMLCFLVRIMYHIKNFVEL